MKKHNPFWVLKRVTNFYRKHNPFELLWSNTYYSQFGEDVFLKSLFFKQTTGYYIDIGAFHPISGSNTYMFYKMGWRGINIEPNPSMFKLLKKYRKKDININKAISFYKGEANFNINSVFSGIMDKNYIYQDRIQKKIKVDTDTLKNILSSHLTSVQSIDFMSIDCEGHDLNVLKSNDWELYRPRVIIVEDHSMNINSEIDSFLKSKDYYYYCRIYLTKVFLEKSEIKKHIKFA